MGTATSAPSSGVSADEKEALAEALKKHDAATPKKTCKKLKDSGEDGVATVADPFYLPEDRLDKECATTDCSDADAGASNAAGTGKDGKVCLVEKPMCNKMSGGDATVACKVGGAKSKADRDKYQLKFIDASSTTHCQKGTCATDKSVTDGTVTAEQGHCCKPATDCETILGANHATLCGTGIYIKTGTTTAPADGSTDKFGGSKSTNANVEYPPTSVGSAATWADVQALSSTVQLAVLNRCCQGGSDERT